MTVQAASARSTPRKRLARWLKIVLLAVAGITLVIGGFAAGYVVAKKQESADVQG